MLNAHSIEEIRLYLKIAGCDRCGKARRWRLEENPPPTVPGNVIIAWDCPACGAKSHEDFAIEQGEHAAKSGYPPPINSTEDRSRLIDAGQWITLAQLLMQEAKGGKDKSRARMLNLQAGQCYDEALKFYDDAENELPPAEAFFTKGSQARFRDAPQQFARSRLIGERAKLPTMHDS